uniref:Prefoldin subunit 4 n=1 Tax=Chromulina nebulosa TaxID=96789 RepID=A0A7S0SVI5_9STRA|mmetsp:Transcript_3583/g.3180  ORF Transcript_3583/g.3180 Transcript_3583/m.3180 type:complete len:132 (+) Transcript_3583:43-438(+)
MSVAVANSTVPKDDVEVRYEDQEKINEFGKLNNRLLEIRAELKQSKTDIETLDDATTELAMVGKGKVMLLIGENFMEVTEEFAEEYCEKKTKKLQSRIEQLENEELSIVSRQDELKKILYGRFGDSINLEN